MIRKTSSIIKTLTNIMHRAYTVIIKWFTIENMLDGLKRFFIDLKNQVGFGLMLVLYIVLYIIQNKIKDLFNVDLSPLLHNKGIIGLFVTAYFINSYTKKENKTDGDWLMLTTFVFVIVGIIISLCSMPESQYERCIDKYQNQKMEVIEKFCNNLSKEITN